MKSLVYAINLTLDGCCDHTQIIPDEGTTKYFTALVQEADILLYGRKTYQLMVPYWPDIARGISGQNDRQADMEFAKAFDSVNRMIVFSHSSDISHEEKTQIIHTGLPDEILKLKQGQGKSIFTSGVNIPSQIAEFGLIDEYHLVVHPIVTGRGPKLFEGINLQKKLQLKLVESKTFDNGVVALHYLKK